MNAKQLIEAATPSGVLIAAAEDLKNRARQGGSQPTMTSDLWLARHILSTVRPDDDEPVTREKMEADENWVMVDTDVYHWKDRYGVMTSYHVTLTQQYSSLLWSSTGVVVRKVKSMGHLRRLVAALGE